LTSFATTSAISQAGSISISTIAINYSATVLGFGMALCNCPLKFKAGP